MYMTPSETRNNVAPARLGSKLNIGLSQRENLDRHIYMWRKRAAVAIANRAPGKCLLLDRELVLLPSLEAAFHLDDRNARRGELDGSRCGQLAGLAVAVDDRRSILRQPRERVPLTLRQVDRAGNVSGLVVARQPHIHDRDRLVAPDLRIELVRSGHIGQLLSKILPRLIRILSRHVQHLTVRARTRCPRQWVAKVGAQRAGIIGVIGMEFIL